MKWGTGSTSGFLCLRECISRLQMSKLVGGGVYTQQPSKTFGSTTGIETLISGCTCSPLFREYFNLDYAHSSLSTRHPRAIQFSNTRPYQSNGEREKGWRERERERKKAIAPGANFPPSKLIDNLRLPATSSSLSFSRLLQRWKTIGSPFTPLTLLYLT